MRDFVLFAHIILGLALIAFPIIILLYLKKQTNWIKPLSFATAAISWILLLPAGKLYITFYPATKTLIKAGSWSWAHSIIMETKEHWGLLLPIIATVAAGMVFTGKAEESKRWWILTIILSALLGIMGRIVKIGALQ
ncbi:hypothetical protein J4448_03785 [Candidatus Woesearchaeota archaeon]|nr:hypothetical protein [Candidatus Woesearchaeota archaeon]